MGLKDPFSLAPSANPAAYASKIMTMLTAHAALDTLPRVTRIYCALGSFRTLDSICVEPGCVPSSDYAFKN